MRMSFRDETIPTLAPTLSLFSFPFLSCHLLSTTPTTPQRHATPRHATALASEDYRDAHRSFYCWLD
jgi:hypothetical protein